MESNRRRSVGLIGAVAAMAGAALSSMANRFRSGIVTRPPTAVGPHEIPFDLPPALGAGRRRRPKAVRRLPIATGPGSISARAEHFRLTEAGQLEAAASLAERHERQCGERLTYRPRHASR